MRNTCSALIKKITLQKNNTFVFQVYTLFCMCVCGYEKYTKCALKLFAVSIFIYDIHIQQHKVNLFECEIVINNNRKTKTTQTMHSLVHFSIVIVQVAGSKQRRKTIGVTNQIVLK